jgi:hypothetical protein
VINVGTDRSQLASVAKEAKAMLEMERLDVVTARSYFNSAKILACERAGITVTLPKPMTSRAKSEGRFGKQDFRYVAEAGAPTPSSAYSWLFIRRCTVSNRGLLHSPTIMCYKAALAKLDTPSRHMCWA